MKLAKQASPAMQELGEKIDHAGVAMLSTLDESGRIVSRPMSPLQLDESGTLWFFTSRSSHKVDQLSRLNVALGDDARANYISISGAGQLFDDRAKMRELWSPMDKPFFPGGVDDPDLALLAVHVEGAEVWSSNESRMVRLFQAATALAANDPASLGEHKVVVNPAAVPRELRM